MRAPPGPVNPAGPVVRRAWGASVSASGVGDFRGAPCRLGSRRRGCGPEQPTMAPADTRDATTSASGTDKKFEVAYCAMPKTTPAVKGRRAMSRGDRAGRRLSGPAPGGRRPPRSAFGGPPWHPAWPSTKPDTLARVMMGVAIAPNATGAVLATNASTAALSAWPEAHGDQHHRGHCHRRAEPGQRFERRPE